jgi:hypothetical protein
LAWTWIEDAVAPRLTPDGIVLRDGNWGTLTPVGLGSDWPSLEWRPRAPQQLSARPVTAFW